MDLKPGGIDVFYIDESERHPLSVVSSIRVPFLRQVEGKWKFVWQDHLARAQTWRSALSDAHNIRSRAELHGYEILAHKGLLLKGNANLRPDQAAALFSGALSSLDILPSASVMVAYADGNAQLMGHKGIKAAMFGLFQRIRRQCSAEKTNGMIIFDDGHPEYISHYRQATRYLPTGSMHGGWGAAATNNFPLDMFPSDANLKPSHHSIFIQIADLVVYSARIKLESELGTLNQKRITRGHHLLFDAVPAATMNKKATGKRADGIIPV